MITVYDFTSSDSIVEDLAWPFDFDVARPVDDPSWIKLSITAEFTVLAGDGAGGVFLSYGDGIVESRPVLHATSEGQAGRIAENLTSLLAMLMAIPFWRDLLKFSGGGNLSEMRKTATFMVREYDEDYPDLPAARERLMAALPIPKPHDPILDLHDAVHASDCTLVGDDGWQYESLFNTFVSADNPSWHKETT